jgi:hypothetical protein
MAYTIDDIGQAPTVRKINMREDTNAQEHTADSARERASKSSKQDAELNAQSINILLVRSALELYGTLSRLDVVHSMTYYDLLEIYGATVWSGAQFNYKTIKVKGCEGYDGYDGYY